MDVPLSPIEIELDFVGNLADDVRRCLNTLYSTPLGSCPLYRDFGLDWSVLDQPLPVAENLLAVEIAEKTARFESRVVVQDVTMKVDAVNGKIQPRVMLGKG